MPEIARMPISSDSQALPAANPSQSDPDKKNRDDQVDDRLQRPDLLLHDEVNGPEENGNIYQTM